MYITITYITIPTVSKAISRPWWYFLSSTSLNFLMQYKEKTENNSILLNLFKSLFTRKYTFNQNGEKIVPIRRQCQDYLWGSSQGLIHGCHPDIHLLCLQLGFLFLEVYLQNPSFRPPLTDQQFNLCIQFHSCSYLEYWRNCAPGLQHWCPEVNII